MPCVSPQSLGSDIVVNPSREKAMVDDLLAYKTRCDAVVTKAFLRGDIFVNALKVTHPFVFFVALCVYSAVFSPSFSLFAELMPGRVRVAGQRST